MRRAETLRVDAGHYFVVGDNPVISCDSRTRGVIPRKMIVAKAVLIWSPLDRIQFL
jgi:signal peptidase I